MSFTIKLDPEEMAKRRLMRQFNLDRFEQEEMKQDVADVTRWFYQNTKNMTADEKRLFCLNFVMNSGMLYMTLLMYFELPLLDFEEIKQLNMNFEPGVSKDLMKYLKDQLSYWEPTTKYINLVLAEMPLKMNLQYEEATDKVVGFQDIDGVRSCDFASKALLMAAQGCLETFFQPLGYAFLSEKDSSDEIITWIKKTIQELENSGYTVCSVISQQTPTFQKMVDRLGVTPQKPYFEVASKKVFYMFDPVYLLIAIRDLLLKTNLFYDNDKLISWSDIVDIHKHCKVLTEAHINPVPAQKINTEKEREKHRELAAEVFNPVICELMTAKYAPEESGTAIFVRAVFNVFKILTDDFQGFLPSYTGTAQQVEAFKEALSMIQRVKLPDDGETQTEVPCFSGLQITLNAIMQLRKHSKPKGMKTVFMSMFNTEQMLVHQEDMQKIIGRKSLNPTQFKYAFSKAMLDDFIRNPMSDSVSSCIGPMYGHVQPPSGFVGQDVGKKENDRLLDSIRSGTFEVLFKDHVVPSTDGKQKRRRIPL